MIISKDMDETMADIEDELSGKSLEERFDKLMQDLIAFQYTMIERQRRTGQSAEEYEQKWIDDSMKHIKNIEKLMAMAKKYGRLSSKPNEKFEAQTIQLIKEMKSSVGEIVRKVPVTKPNEQDPDTSGAAK